MSESMTVSRPTYEILTGLAMKLEKLSLTASTTTILLFTSSVNVNCKLPEFELPAFKGQAVT